MTGLLVSLAAALAGEVYLNGVRAEEVPVMSLENVSVRFDAQGNVWIDAPMYRVSVAPPPPVPTAYTPPPPAYSSPGYTPVPAAVPAYVPAPAPPALGEIKAGRWWLVTEDNDSRGQDIEVVVNGVSVRHVRSGEPQAIVDVGTWLRSGTNTITLRAAGGSYAGGMLVIYVGQGSESGGTVRMDAPDVRYSRRALDLGSGGEKSFIVTIP